MQPERQRRGQENDQSQEQVQLQRLVEGKNQEDENNIYRNQYPGSLHVRKAVIDQHERITERRNGQKAGDCTWRACRERICTDVIAPAISPRMHRRVQ